MDLELATSIAIELNTSRPVDADWREFCEGVRPGLTEHGFRILALCDAPHWSSRVREVGPQSAIAEAWSHAKWEDATDRYVTERTRKAA